MSPRSTPRHDCAAHGAATRRGPTRRDILGGALALGGVCLLPRWARADDTSAPPRRRTIVLLHLEGGNDGLNTVVPYADAAYSRLRPSLAIERDRVRRLDETTGLHPSLTGLEALWQRKRLAIVEGVGYPDPSLSHFRATEIWHTGQPERAPTHGWIGRALDAHPRQAPLRSVGLATEPPLSLAMSGPGSITMTSFERFRVPSSMQGAAGLWRQHADATGLRGDLARAGTEALDVAARLASMSPAGGPYVGPLGDKLRLVESLLVADLDLDAIHLGQGGYDTHSNQTAQHARLLQQLGTNLDVFQRRLEAAKLADRVVVFVFSEFGRRASENLSGGTDHGTAGPVFVIGTGLRPGRHGAPASLAELDRENLVYTTDLRSVQASLLSHAYQIDPAPVVGDFAPLELFA